MGTCKTTCPIKFYPLEVSSTGQRDDVHQAISDGKTQQDSSPVTLDNTDTTSASVRTQESLLQGSTENVRMDKHTIPGPGECSKRLSYS